VLAIFGVERRVTTRFHASTSQDTHFSIQDILA